MPFDKFVDIQTLQKDRREAVHQSLREITLEELKKVVNENLSDFEGDPWQANFLRIIEENPQGSFYHAVTREGAIVLYCRDENAGVWVLPGSGMGPLPDEGKRHAKEAIGLPVSSEPIAQSSRFLSESHNQTNNRLVMKTLSILSALLLAAFSSGCSRKSAEVAPPPPEVLVTTVMPRDVAVVHDGVATLEGFITANINAQVQGYIISRDYKEGNLFKKGDLLFQIDPRPFEATLDQAKGNLAVAQSNQIKADADVKRALKLFQGKVISDQERDTYLNAASSTKANVQAAEAAVRQAEVSLGYTKIVAPIDGIVGIASAHVGDLVGPGTGSLTTISQVDPIKAAVNVGEQSFNEFLTDHSDADEREQYLKGLGFDLLLGNGNLYPHKGTFYAEDRNLDTKTGAIRMELTFPNPGNRLRPGQFGKVRAVIKVEKDALVIPQEAVTELQGTQMVGVVDADSKVNMRPVEMGERSGAMWQVLEGLKAGEKVVVQGMMKVRPGMPVTVKDWTPSREQLASNDSAQGKEN
jgi:RND family efflux transporter MFP subunit